MSDDPQTDDEWTRRGFLAAGLGIVTALGLAACGSSPDEAAVADTHPDTTASTTAAGPGPTSDGFHYTDGRGQRIDLDRAPKVVVAQSSSAAALWDAGFTVAGVYGELQKVDGKLDYQAGNLQLDDMVVIGQTYGEFAIERYATLNPELLVDATMDGKTLWYIPQDAASTVLPMAPSIGMKMLGLDTPALIAEYVDLATRLGAPADSARAAADKTAFEQAVSAVRAKADGAKLRVLAVSLTTDNFYVADPRDHPDLRHLAALGVDLVVPDEPAGAFFHEYSWERAGDFPADVIIYDVRGGDPIPDQVAKIGTWKALAAVGAGQVHPWKPAAPYSYRAYAPLYQDIAGWLGADQPLS
jgi:iron complex transport system substrate-binding protein